ncbi:hypothetical protein DXA32_12210 [Subdoligranulum sp. OF01-18]|jgi:hypothetical protein|uniref:Tail spike domain-containing protein n=1 Tax=Ruthenibacterium lactatiformans TaxID=1550024 RepID=A0A6I2U5U3_9FIRM|nr:phage tail spike protein [Ruthenibacterium lactatiformans]MST93097.1 hypothetical protein [Ruthenibacterium lactatiformans]RJW81139.1 hypothetical protein DXA32_12210 [Subdoligranulum sp. OF01-18]
MLKILQADGGQIPLDFDKYFIQEETNGEDQIGFTLPLDHADYKLLAEEVQLLDAEDGQVYRITAIDEGAATANIKGKLELSPLRADMRIPYTNGSDTLAGTVEGVLPAGWTVVDHSLSTIRRTIDLDSATPEDVILGAASAFGGLAIRYKIADKAVHFYAPGDFKAGGVYLTEELNLTSTNFKGSSSGLCTRLYARGKDGLTFAGINGGKDYVENFSYTDKIICAYWEDERYTVAENLLEAAQKKVDASAVPVRSYSCGVVDLAKAWRYEEGAGSNIYAHLNIQLLTVATLLDTRRGTRIDHQVVQYKRYPHYPDLNVVTLSTKAPTITTTVKQLQDAIENPSSSFRKQMQSLINQMAAGISGHDGGTMEITFNSDGKPNGIRWGDGDDLATSQKVLWLNLEGVAYGQNGVNGDYSTVWSFAQNGFVADWIVVGTLTANLIKTGLLQSKNGKSWINLDTGAAQLAGTFLSGTDAFLAELSGGMLRFSQNGTYVGGLYSNTWGDQKTLSFSGSAVHVRSRIDDAGIALSAAVQGGVTGEIKSQPSLMVFDGKGQVISLQIADGESKIIFNGYECTLKERTVDGQTIRYLGAL